MANNNGGKGNPASTRMSNAARKTRRSLSWQRAQKRHEANRKAQEARASENREFVADFVRVVGAAGVPAKRPSKQARAIRRLSARAQAQVA